MPRAFPQPYIMSAWKKPVSQASSEAYERIRPQRDEHERHYRRQQFRSRRMLDTLLAIEPDHTAADDGHSPGFAIRLHASVWTGSSPSGNRGKSSRRCGKRPGRGEGTPETTLFASSVSMPVCQQSGESRWIKPNRIMATKTIIEIPLIYDIQQFIIP